MGFEQQPDAENANGPTTTEAEGVAELTDNLTNEAGEVTAESQEVLAEIEQLQNEGIELEEQIEETQQGLVAKEHSKAQEWMREIEEEFRDKANALSDRWNKIQVGVLGTIGGGSAVLMMGEAMARDPSLLEELRDLLRDTNAMSKEYLQELKALEERANTSTE
jgi:hypothetical protein